MVVVVIQIEKRILVLSFVPRDGGHVVEIGQILHADGQVEAHLLADGLLGLQVAALAHHHARGVGGQHGEQEEHQRHHAEHQQQAVSDLFDYVTKHGGKDTIFGKKIPILSTWSFCKKIFLSINKVSLHTLALFTKISMPPY